MNEIMEKPVVGLKPWLPWPLDKWGWWSDPVRAERLAVLRIALAAVLLIDLLTSYRPHLHEFFGKGGLGGSQMFAYYGEAPKFNWSLLRGFGEGFLGSWQDNAFFLEAAFWAWVLATFFLMVGFWTRPAALVTWALSMSFANVNPNIDNSGDTIRGIILFYLMLCPCGAAWSIDCYWQRRRQAFNGSQYVWPWPLRLLFIQMVFIYFMNGLYKVVGANWVSGDSLYYILGDLTLTRVSIADLPVTFVLAQIATWLVLAWELTFPVLVLFRRTRAPALWFGVAFHLAIFATMELGGFVPYILCLYLPLLPWENLEG